MNELKLFDKFLKQFPLDNNPIIPGEDYLRDMSPLVPAELILFWKTHGFCSCGDGQLKIIDPVRYMPSLYTWLGREDHSKIPIMVTAFGNILYYRRLDENEDDICLLDIHNRKVEVLSYSFADFFNVTADNKALMSEIFDSELYRQAVAKLGKLEINEIFCFAPALIAGGERSVSSIKKGDAAVHHQLLFQLGL